jgi:putative ABC transport system permease protein
MPAFRAFTAGQVADRNAAILAAKAMSWTVSAIAVVVGAVGVANTMLMSVFERIQEIGILLAVGWRRSRIVAMILYESLVLGLVGGIAGIAIGVAGVRVLERTALLRGKVEADLGLSIVGLALFLSIGLGVLGGIYPAMRGARMRPADALRYE